MEETTRSPAPWCLSVLPYGTLPSIVFNLYLFVTSQIKLWKTVTSISLTSFQGLILEVSCYSEPPCGEACPTGQPPGHSLQGTEAFRPVASEKQNPVNNQVTPPSVECWEFPVIPSIWEIQSQRTQLSHKVAWFMETMRSVFQAALF